MDKPHFTNAPGLVLRPRNDGWTAQWQCRTDIAKKGFEPKSWTVAEFRGVTLIRLYLPHIEIIAFRQSSKPQRAD